VRKDRAEEKAQAVKAARKAAKKEIHRDSEGE
jgi:hypothetical protein